MKKLINRRETVIEEMLQGMAALHPGLVRLSPWNVMVRSDFATIRDREVALISGGGSGHEPAHAGYVAPGMLSAAVAGEIFTSPSADSIFQAIKAVAGKPGVLLIVKNYTGDRLNFGLAAEMARAEGIPVKLVIVADDVALLSRQPNSETEERRRQLAQARGLAGVVLIHKIAGASAAEGKSLDEVSAAASAAASALATMGLALSAGASASLEAPGFFLNEREIELGLGIHGEPGVQRMALMSARELVSTLVERIVSARALRSGDRVAVLVNNLGSTTAMEIDIVAHDALSILTSRGLKVERLYSGTMLTSLDMAGISLTLLSVDEERLRLLDAATSAPAWPNFPRRSPAPASVASQAEPVRLPAQNPPQSVPGKLADRAIRAACAALLQSEPLLTRLDQAVGDGDLGISMARGATAVEEALPGYPLDDLPAALKAIGYTLQRELGGSSGPFYGVLFLRTASALAGRAPLGLRQWAEALAQGCDAVSELGGAHAGDRTMLDALVPFLQALKDRGSDGRPAREALNAAVNAALRGAQQTAQMLPRRGRSAYLGERALGHPDPGAIAVSIWLKAAVESI